MLKVGAGSKRPYMSSQERRRALLDVAAEIVGHGGWSALTMKGLALAAGVSRQLVYEHFDDGRQLFLSVMRHLFEQSYKATAEVLKGGTGDVPSTIREAYQIFLDMPAAQRRALRALSGDLGPDRPETRSARALMRDQILSLWVPYARRQTGLAEGELRPIVWMLTSASWGLAELVEDGGVSEDQAKDVLAQFVERVMLRSQNKKEREDRRRQA